MVQEGHLGQNSQFIADVTYLAGPRGIEYRQDDSTGQKRYYVYDGLGSVIAEVGVEDANHNPVKCTRKYGVYGYYYDETGTSNSTNKFCGGLGHAVDDNTNGLIYMRARWYDPRTCRFISEDPAGDGTNWYAYCNNNPANLADSTGKAPGITELLFMSAAALGCLDVIENLHDKCPWLSHVVQLISYNEMLIGSINVLIDVSYCDKRSPTSYAVGGVAALVGGLSMTIALTQLLDVCALLLGEDCEPYHWSGE